MNLVWAWRSLRTWVSQASPERSRRRGVDLRRTVPGSLRATRVQSRREDILHGGLLGSEWNALGEAVAGEVEAKRLEPVVSIDHFWFSWRALRSETRVYEPQNER